MKLQHYRNIHLDHEIRALLQVIEYLVLDETLNFKNDMCDLKAESFPELKYLCIDVFFWSLLSLQVCCKIFVNIIEMDGLFPLTLASSLWPILYIINPTNQEPINWRNY